MATPLRTWPRNVLWVAPLVLLCGAARSQADTLYRVTEIGALGAAVGVANGVNDAGTVVGNVTYADGHRQAFVWTRADGVRRVDLQTRESTAAAISNKGVIVGSALTADPSPDAAVWVPGIPRQDIAWGSYGAEATGINNHGQVVGYRNDGALVIRSHAFSWPADDPYSAWRDLYSDDEDSFASQVNDRGQIVGYAAGNAVILDRNFLSTVLQPQIALPPVSAGIALNDRGDVLMRQCGIPFLISRKGAEQISDSATVVPRNLNASGTVVGYVDEGAKKGFVWDRQRGLTILDDVLADSGWQISSANAINIKGEIAGYGIKNGRRRAVLLTPVSGPK